VTWPVVTEGVRTHDRIRRLIAGLTAVALNAPISISRTPVPVVVMQHVEEAAHLRHVRSMLVRAPHVRLLQLGRLDERIAAHLDGIQVAGPYGARLALQSLDRPGVGEVFVATVGAIGDRDADRLRRLLAITEALPAARAGLLSALGWISAADLQSVTRSLLVSEASPWARQAGLASCAMHAVSPEASLAAVLQETDGGLRSCGLRAAGQCARLDLLEACLAALVDSDPRSAIEAARSALLLGDRTESQAMLQRLAVERTDSSSLAAMRLVLKVTPPERARTMLATLAQDAAHARALIHGIAIAGDPHYVPWLIGQMQDSKLTRLAGEAFAFITGLDLAYLDLDRKPPEGVELGPNGDPENGNVAMDEDDSLPWPDPEKISGWWRAHGSKFGSGTRYFMGAVPTPATCLEVLKTGFQRQRIAAAEYLSLLTPGTPLFNTAAPAWRQQRLLQAMTI
jgi:uncharacterized protein (TIGR02270 family)